MKEIDDKKLLAKYTAEQAAHEARVKQLDNFCAGVKVPDKVGGLKELIKVANYFCDNAWRVSAFDALCVLLAQFEGGEDDQ